jgi:hypothetical protein
MLRNLNMEVFYAYPPQQVWQVITNPQYAARKRLGVDAIELPGGHCPYLSRPIHLASVLCA